MQTTTTADRCFEPDATHTYVVLTEVNESYVERWSGTLDVVAAADLAPDKREVVSEAADTDCRVPSDAFSARSDRHPDVVAVDGSYYWLLVERKLVTVESL